jgi:hypothetical protein
MPALENLKVIRNLTTGKEFACTATDLAMPQDWRTAIAPAVTRHGGVDGHAGSNDYLSPRAISANIIHVYDRAAGETFKTVTYALETVITRGDPLELIFVEEDETAWVFEGARLTKYDKKMNKDMAILALFPLAFTAPDPRQRAQYEVGRLLLNNGLLLDDGHLLNDDPNTFDLSGTQTIKHFLNTGPAPDDALVLTLEGPIFGAVSVSYYDDAGNVRGFSYAADQNGWGVQAGEVLTVDGEQLEVVSNISTDAYSRFFPFPNQEGWGEIASGDNTVIITSAGMGAPASCSLKWFPRK